MYWRLDHDVRILSQFPMLLNLDIREYLCICFDICKVIPIEFPCFVDWSKFMHECIRTCLCVCVCVFFHYYRKLYFFIYIFTCLKLNVFVLFPITLVI